MEGGNDLIVYVVAERLPWTTGTFQARAVYADKGKAQSAAEKYGHDPVKDLPGARVERFEVIGREPQLGLFATA